MCIIIDTCAFHCVFDNRTPKHKEYKPVGDWLLARKGKLVYGGQKYAIELLNNSQYIRLFLEFERSAQLFHAPEDKVNALSKEIQKRRLKDCDDEHIIALSIVSGCRLVCTEDKRSCGYLKSIPRMYGKPRIKAYTRSEHKKFLTCHEIKSNCDLCAKGTNTQGNREIVGWLAKYSKDPRVRSTRGIS